MRISHSHITKFFCKSLTKITTLFLLMWMSRLEISFCVWFAQWKRFDRNVWHSCCRETKSTFLAVLCDVHEVEQYDGNDPYPSCERVYIEFIRAPATSHLIIENCDQVLHWKHGLFHRFIWSFHANDSPRATMLTSAGHGARPRAEQAAEWKLNYARLKNPTFWESEYSSSSRRTKIWIVVS